MRELLTIAHLEDPVRGIWQVSLHGAVTVWTDASSLGLGVALEVDGSIVEDVSSTHQCFQTIYTLMLLSLRLWIME